MKKIFFLNLTSRGVNRGVTQFHVQFTQVSRQFLAFNRKQKKLFRENCFENMVSVLSKKIQCVHQISLNKKCAFKIFSFLGFYFFVLFFQGHFMD